MPSIARLAGDDRHEGSLAHFRAHGWMRINRAFDTDAAACMRAAVWQALAAVGIHRDRRETWTVERPSQLQSLKKDPVFQAVGSPALIEAIDAVLESKSYAMPKDWGGFFIAFPGDGEWNVPSGGWHIDANYASPLWPASGVKTLALLGDVASRGGGTQIVSGSHRLVHRWFRDNPAPAGTRSAKMRQLLLSHPYIRDLHRNGSPADRIARFVNNVEEVEGIPLCVCEATGVAGDVIILHPLLLHVAAPNLRAEPRFLLSGGITTDMWGWGQS